MNIMIYPVFKIENMVETCGPGWWNDTPWRFVSDDSVHIGQPQPSREEAEEDLEQYIEQLMVDGDFGPVPNTDHDWWSPIGY